MIYFADTRTADDGEKIPAPIATRSIQPGSLWRFKKPASEICEIRWHLVSKSGIDFIPPNCQIWNLTEKSFQKTERLDPCNSNNSNCSNCLASLCPASVLLLGGTVPSYPRGARGEKNLVARSQGMDSVIERHETARQQRKR